VHRLCGEPRVAGAECPNCRKPLLPLLELDAADPRLALAGTGLERLPILFCWTCEAAQSTIIYRVEEAGRRITLLQFHYGAVVEDFPYEAYPVYFPGHDATLASLTDAEQVLLHRINIGEGEAIEWPTYREYAVPRHQVGGEPYLVQPLDDVACPDCGAAMPLFATLGDDTWSEQKFTGNDWVQTLVHLCRRCGTIGIYQRCD
jgi:hypothetical protein